MPVESTAATALKARFPSATDRASRDHAACNVPLAEVPAVMHFLRDEQGFDHLADLTAVDWAEGASPRFTVVYNLFAIARGEYIRVAADCTNDLEPAAPTVTHLWPGANWHERECFDMFGITFEGHPDLRRILMWDGYPYHPLRKEFPLAGIETVLPDAEIAEVTKTPVIAAPMAGGPFVASPGEINMADAEPSAKDQSWNERKPKTE